MYFHLTVFLIFLFFKPNKCSVTSTYSQETCVIYFSDGDYEEFEFGMKHNILCIERSQKLNITLNNYMLPALPNNSFSNLGHKKRFILLIDKASKLQLLLPGLPNERLFENSRFDSVVFEATDLPTLIGWKWKILANLSISEGFEFTAVRSKLVYLHSDFGFIANGRVRVVRILRCQLRWLGKNVFAPLSYLKTLELRDNLIESIERSHLPTYAPELKVLDLGNNKLKTLPDDFIDGLNVKSVFLGGNNLKISEAQAIIFFNLKEFPLLSGVLWPCICNESSFGTFYKDQKCYKDDQNKTFSYLEICSNQR